MWSSVSRVPRAPSHTQNSSTSTSMPCASCSVRHSPSTPGAPWTAAEKCQNGLSHCTATSGSFAALVYIAALRHDRTMTDILTNAPRPITTLRDWLDHLAARDRLAVIPPNVSLKFELAAIAKRLDGTKATLFPQPGGHAMPVISGLVSDRQWIAEAMGVEAGDVLARFQDAALNPLPWNEVKTAPVQEVVHREVDLGRRPPLPTHNEHDKD